MSDETKWPFVIVGGPWPERIGRRCRAVTKELEQDRYPVVGLGLTEAVVLIEDDPFWRLYDHDPRWSCVLGIYDVERIPESEENA